MITTRHIHRLSRFVLTNSVGTFVDLLILWLLSHFVFASYTGQYLVSPLISFECAVLTNFFCSWHFVWSDRVKQRAGIRFGHKYLLYNLSATGAFLIKMIFLLLFERLFKWNVVLCNLVALCLSGTINFAMGEWVIFKVDSKKVHRDVS
ncbi:MAG: GtrA family protein [Bacteroidaceae bacterium]|jgi:putative flippase GtrA|nr:GtrA family protein [Bacteroidaceae bacterium]